MRLRCLSLWFGCCLVPAQAGASSALRSQPPSSKSPSTQGSKAVAQVQVGQVSVNTSLFIHQPFPVIQPSPLSPTNQLCQPFSCHPTTTQQPNQQPALSHISTVSCCACASLFSVCVCLRLDPVAYAPALPLCLVVVWCLRRPQHQVHSGNRFPRCTAMRSTHTALRSESGLYPTT